MEAKEDGEELFDWDLDGDDDVMATQTLSTRDGDFTGPSAPTDPLGVRPSRGAIPASVPEPPRPPRPPTRSTPPLPPAHAPPRAPTLSGAYGALPPLRAPSPSRPFSGYLGPQTAPLPPAASPPMHAASPATLPPPTHPAPPPTYPAPPSAPLAPLPPPQAPPARAAMPSYAAFDAYPPRAPEPALDYGSPAIREADMWDRPGAGKDAFLESEPPGAPEPGGPPGAPSAAYPFVRAEAAAPAPQPAAPPHFGSLSTTPLAQTPAGPQGFAPYAAPQAAARAATAHPPTQAQSAAHIERRRVYSFALDARGMPIELGAGRFAKAYLGEERWLESKTDYRREIVIKVLQKGVSVEDHMRFQMEKELLERVQGHPNIVELYGSGEGDVEFIPPSIRDLVEPEYLLLERLEMSLEERLKGSRLHGQKEDLLALPMGERVLRVLDVMVPVASAVEYAHLVRNICHRDLKPANVLVKLADPALRGAVSQVRLADFNAAKLKDDDVHFGMTQMHSAVPGTLFFQSPEQETNVVEMLVNVQHGALEVEYFEDFYIPIAKDDSFSLWNRGEPYPVAYADRARKRLVLATPYREVSETNVRARIQKAVGRPADIYSLGAMLYYLISGAYANPKALHDAFRKFVDYEATDAANTIESYIQHEYAQVQSLQSPGLDSSMVSPANRFFSFKHYLDGNGELIDGNTMLIVAKCMIRNKPDSYCQAHDLDTRGISQLVEDLRGLSQLYGRHMAAQQVAQQLARPAPQPPPAAPLAPARPADGVWERVRRLFAGQ
ncbi:MAG: protein kinase [Myxococcales bacterium]|nr:protein kinase [Myxococcales bacterium]